VGEPARDPLGPQRHDRRGGAANGTQDDRSGRPHRERRGEESAQVPTICFAPSWQSRKISDSKPLTLQGSEYPQAVQELNKAIDRAEGLLSQ